MDVLKFWMTFGVIQDNLIFVSHDESLLNGLNPDK